jgi:hypothetical protein
MGRGAHGIPWRQTCCPGRYRGLAAARRLFVRIRALPDPLALNEILSPSTAVDTWDDVWTYATIPSVREIADGAFHPRCG